MTICVGRNSNIFFGQNWELKEKKIARKDSKYCGTDVTRTASLIHLIELAQFQSSKAVQFRCAKLRLHTAAVPACNVECSVDWNHQVVFGAIKDGWTHRKANHQTWGREIREGGGSQVKAEDFYRAGICSLLQRTKAISRLTCSSMSDMVYYIYDLWRNQIMTHLSVQKLPLHQPL